MYIYIYIHKYISVVAFALVLLFGYLFRSVYYYYIYIVHVMLFVVSMIYIYTMLLSKRTSYARSLKPWHTVADTVTGTVDHGCICDGIVFGVCYLIVVYLMGNLFCWCWIIMMSIWWCSIFGKWYTHDIPPSLGNVMHLNNVCP